MCGLGIMCYFTIFYLENLFPMFPQVFLIFDTTFMQPSVWLTLFLCTFIASFGEMLYNYVVETGMFGLGVDKKHYFDHKE